MIDDNCVRMAHTISKALDCANLFSITGGNRYLDDTRMYLKEASEYFNKLDYVEELDWKKLLNPKVKSVPAE